MKEPIDWENVFNDTQPCDFCENDDAVIARVHVHPTWKFRENGVLVFYGPAFSKKCMECIEKEIDDLEIDE